MAVDKRQKNQSWNVVGDDGRALSWEAVNCAVLMDIRDELQRLNSLLHCQNFTDIPMMLRKIHRKIPARKKKR